MPTPSIAHGTLYDTLFLPSHTGEEPNFFKPLTSLGEGSFPNLEAKMDERREAVATKEHLKKNMREFEDFFRMKLLYPDDNPDDKFKDRLIENMKRDNYKNAAFWNYIVDAAAFMAQDEQGRSSSTGGKTANEYLPRLRDWIASDDKTDEIREIISFNLDKKAFRHDRNAWKQLSFSLGLHAYLFPKEEKVLVRYGCGFRRSKHLNRETLMKVVSSVLEGKDLTNEPQFTEETQCLREAHILNRRMFGGNRLKKSRSSSSGSASTLKRGAAVMAVIAVVVILAFVIPRAVPLMIGSHVQTYTVTLVDENNVPLLNFDSQWQIPGGSSIHDLVPEKQGYRFVGWLLNGEAYSASSPVSSDITLVADWEAETFTVSFDCGAEYPGETPKPMEISASQPLDSGNLPVLEWDGRDFLGWTLDGTAPFTGVQPVTENITLTAMWKESTPDTFAVTLDYGYAVPADATKVYHVQSGENLMGQLVTPRREGYQFKGWLLGDAPFDETTPITADVTLTANWEAEMRTVTFQYDTAKREEALKMETSAVQVPYEGLVTPPDITRLGYVLDGWYRDDQLYSLDSPVTEDMTLTAQWKDGVIVTFYDPVTDEAQPKTKEPGQPVDPPQYFGRNRTGYRNAVWQKDGLDYDFTQPVWEDITLTARWIPEDQTVRTVTFAIRDTFGKLYQSYQQTVGDGEPARKPRIPLDDGAALAVWQVEGETLPYDFTAPVTSNITLTAVRTSKTHTVTFVMKEFGDIEGVEDQIITVQDGAVISHEYDPGSIKWNHYFVGWYYDSDFTKPYDSEPVYEDITLYPKLVPVDTESTPSQGFLGGLFDFFRNSRSS